MGISERTKDIARSKIRDIFYFSLSSLKFMFTSFIMGFFVLITLAIVGNNLSGDWSLGTSFNEWWESMATIAPVNGKFSAIDPGTCLVCDIFAKCFDLMSMLGLKMYVYIADIAWTLITMGFAVWILIYMYNHLIIEQDSNFKQMGLDIAKKIIVISIIGAALFFNTDKEKNEKYLQNIANTIVDNTAVPLLKMGVGVSAEILDTNVCSHLNYPKSEVDGMLSPSLKEDMLCLLNSISSVYLSAMTAGSNMVSMSWNNFSDNPVKNAGNLPDILAGMALIAIFLIMYVAIPFMLIDIVFTLGILITFLPLMIGGYAYDRTKNFSSVGIKSLWGMCFYIIIYSIALSVMYSSFIYIADMYYPGPLDNFTYLFPDFIYNNMVSGQLPSLKGELSKAFTSCVNSANGNLNAIKVCLANKGMDFEIPSLENPGGSFLPMFTFGLLSIILMGSVKKYTSLIKGYMFTIGDATLSLLKSSWKYATQKVEQKISWIKEKKGRNDIIKENINNQADQLDDEARSV